MANRNKTTERIKYLVERSGKPDFLMEVPANWKVTFGAVNPGGQMGRHDLHCVRVWEGEKLRGVFCDCRGLRDLSIPFATKNVQTESKAEWTRDSDGNFDGSESMRVLESWTDGEIQDSPF